jgi:hypothetical protein
MSCVSNCCTLDFYHRFKYSQRIGYPSLLTWMTSPTIILLLTLSFMWRGTAWHTWSKHALPISQLNKQMLSWQSWQWMSNHFVEYYREIKNVVWQISIRNISIRNSHDSHDSGLDFIKINFDQSNGHDSHDSGCQTTLSSIIENSRMWFDMRNSHDNHDSHDSHDSNRSISWQHYCHDCHDCDCTCWRWTIATEKSSLARQHLGG